MSRLKSIRIVPAILMPCLIALLLTVFGSYSQAAKTSDSSPFAGVWKGWTNQLEPQKQYYSVLNIVSGDVGSVVGTTVYPELACGGLLTLISADSNSLFLGEKLTYGWARCYNNGYITLTLQTSNTLNLDWYSLQVATVATSTLELLNNTNNQLSEEFFGIWQGERMQQDSATGATIPPSSSTVQLGIAKSVTNTVVGNIAYPSLNCGGELVLQEATTSAIKLSEQITYGNCTEGGTISLVLQTDGTLFYRWEKEGLVEIGKLRRISNLKSIFLPIISRH